MTKSDDGCTCPSYCVGSACPIHGLPITEWFNEKSEEPMTKRDDVLISVYLDTGVVFEYEVATTEKAREHAAAIIKTGYRHTPDGSSDLEWFPPHRIEKVKIFGGGESNYKDKSRAT